MKLHNHRSGFTLIELLIVTVVIVTLMGLVFRLAGLGTNDRAKAMTIERMQRIENALSGYYAAYGCYPPVPLQGRSRSIYKAVDSYGLQESGDNETGEKSDFKSRKMMRQILAACQAQPVSVSWPAPTENDEGRNMRTFCTSCRNEAPDVYGKGFSLIDSPGGMSSRLNEINWRGTKNGEKGVQVFEFGLLSFLLPRYLFMLEGGSGIDEFYDHTERGRGGRVARRRSQWAANNQLPCKLDSGDVFDSWKDVRKALNSNERERAWMISNLTSQAVCARWMPNFKGIVTTVADAKYRYFYGVDIYTDYPYYMEIPDEISGRLPSFISGSDPVWGRRWRVFSGDGFTSGGGGGGGGGGNAHFLLCMTVCDGWRQEFYYYSEPPYQSYRLWSAGPNGATFPPWYDLSQFSGDQLDCIRQFIEDDIVHLSN